jgi:hypothetical protein
VYTRRRRSSSGSRRSRLRRKRLGTYSTEQGSQCTQGGGGLKEKHAKRKEISYINIVKRGHRTHRMRRMCLAMEQRIISGCQDMTRLKVVF